MSEQGRQAGRDAVKAINEAISMITVACAGDPLAVAVATSMVARHLSDAKGEDTTIEVVRRERRNAIIALHAGGMKDADIAERLGVDASRVRQLRLAAREADVAGPRRVQPVTTPAQVA